MQSILFNAIIIILIAEFALSRFLDYLNASNRKQTLPDVLKGIYDEEKYLKSQAYDRINTRFSAITSIFNLVLILIVLFAGVFGILDNHLRAYTLNPILLALGFFGVIFIVSDIINTPFSIYDTFVIEELYGFNKTTVKTFIADKLKGWLLAALIGSLLISLIVLFYMKTGVYFWIWAWSLISAFMIFMAMFYSSLIVPLFNKQNPLEDGELKIAISEFATKAGFKLDNVFVIDGSKRSSKANAYFSGLGAKKRIVLYDTLIKDLSTDEIVAVLAHEIGHYRKKHVLTSILLGVLQIGFSLFVLSLFMNKPEFSTVLGAGQKSFHMSLITFGLFFTPVNLVTGLLMNLLSRKNEYQADAFANSYGLGEHLISGLKKLSSNNLSNLMPHKVYVFFHYSHPTLLQRIERIRMPI